MFVRSRTHLCTERLPEKPKPRSDRLRGFVYRLGCRRRDALWERRGSERPNYFFFAFLRFAAFFRFGAFLAAPFEAAAVARLRLAFMRSNPLCRRNAAILM
jgi:hypothetical protein